MRLVNVDTEELEDFESEDIPPYAILSHTWRDAEVTFKDMGCKERSDNARYTKIRYCCRQASADGLQYVWIDTCCIGKTSSSELSEAINSMYQWYRKAYCCYVFLEDYPALKSDPHEQTTESCSHRSAEEDRVQTSEDAFCSLCFRQCRWFERGWTLQELLAPTFLKFYNRDWLQIGYLGGLKNEAPLEPYFRPLAMDIQKATSIPARYFKGHRDFSAASIAQRFSWVSRRRTKRSEDLAYCLLGLFDVSMPILYGERLKKAFRRLQEEIMKVNDDQSIFAWNLRQTPQGLVWDHSQYVQERELMSQKQLIPFRSGPLLAMTPADFKDSQGIIPCKRSTLNSGDPHYMTNRGLRIDTHFIKNEVMLWFSGRLFLVSKNIVSYVLLGCIEKKDPFCPIAMCVVKLGGNVYARALHENAIAAVVDRPSYRKYPLRSIFLLQQP